MSANVTENAEGRKNHGKVRIFYVLSICAVSGKFKNKQLESVLSVDKFCTSFKVSIFFGKIGEFFSLESGNPEYPVTTINNMFTQHIQKPAHTCIYVDNTHFFL